MNGCGMRTGGGLNMDQLELLWQYQQVDMEVERFEREIRQDPNRQTLLKHREFIMKQQETVKRIESEVAVMADRLEALRDEVVRLSDNMAEIATQLEQQEPQSLEGTRTLIASAQRLMGTITRYESELAKLRKDADARDRQQHEVRVRAAKVKLEYDQLKKDYDEVYKGQASELEQLKARAGKAMKEIAPDMLERYNTIKRHSLPPMARLNEDRCGGCNMSLPSVVLHKIRSGSATVECENCGRILLVK